MLRATTFPAKRPAPAGSIFHSAHPMRNHRLVAPQSSTQISFTIRWSKVVLVKKYKCLA